MATEQTLTTLIINKVDSKDTFNKMKAQGLVDENELYLTPEEATSDSLPLSGGTLTGPLAMSNNKITNVGDPTSDQDVVTISYLQAHYIKNQSGTAENLTVNGSIAFNGGTSALIDETGDGITVIGKLYGDDILNPIDNTEFVQKIYVDTACNDREPITRSQSGTGSIVKTLYDHYDYTFNNVSSLNLTAGTGSCHGFITFGSSTPTVSLSGFTKVDGDIANAAASTVWEFSCYNKYAVFKNWSEV